MKCEIHVKAKRTLLVKSQSNESSKSRPGGQIKSKLTLPCCGLHMYDIVRKDVHALYRYITCVCVCDTCRVREGRTIMDERLAFFFMRVIMHACVPPGSKDNISHGEGSPPCCMSRHLVDCPANQSHQIATN